jgi:signal transduction histidine kinase/CheY-like chemotaxis protein
LGVPRTELAPTDEASAPAEAARASFVAVSGLAGDDPSDRRMHPIEGSPEVDVRLDAATLGTLAKLLPTFLGATLLTDGAALTAALAEAGEWQVPAVFATVSALLAAACWYWRMPLERAARHRSPARRWWFVALLCLALPAALVWLPGVREAVPRLGLLTVLVACSAFAGAALLAPAPRIGWAITLLPLSPALAAVGVADEGWVIVAGALATLTAIGIVAARRREWRAGARALALRDVRITAVASERDAALRADQEKSRFLAIASHDLRQPVHAIGLFAATLERRLQGSDEEPLVRNMIRAIDGLDRSFNAMLDVSRLDAGTIEPNVQRFALRDLFRRLHMHFAGQAEQQDLGLRFSPGGKSVNSDPQLLERILGNLVQNALKYTEQGGVVVVARSTATHLNVEVWDTGRGIAAADLHRIFEEFYQVGRSERARAQGLGMGLAIVKRLAKLLNHSLMVASWPGRGTMFRVGIALGALGDIQDTTAAADTRPIPLTQPHAVLVIDDEEAIREGLRLLLEEWGYEAITAASAAAAERAIVSLGILPELILSDLHLGDGPDGIAAVAAVRRQCGHDVAAILITGDTSHDEMRRVTESGLPMLLKPVQPRKLYNVLRGLLP